MFVGIDDIAYLCNSVFVGIDDIAYEVVEIFIGDDTDTAQSIVFRED